MNVDTGAGGGGVSLSPEDAAVITLGAALALGRLVNAGVEAFTGQKEGDSAKLAANLTAAGAVRQPCQAAHHIVAGDAKKAQPAQDILRTYGIDINGATNGVFLPHDNGSLTCSNADFHNRLHTDDYYNRVNQRISSSEAQAKARAKKAGLSAEDTNAYVRSSVEKMLRYIGNELSNGNVKF